MRINNEDLDARLNLNLEDKIELSKEKIKEWYEYCMNTLGLKDIFDYMDIDY